jgi:hypothetical protein
MTTIKTQNQQKREITNSIQLYVNSSNADIYMNGNINKSSCAFFFEELLKISRNALEMSVTVVNAQIPYSFYIINQYNNHIKIDDVDYYFTYGNYNVNSFLTLWSNTIPGTWTNSFNTTNNKFTFSNNTSFTISDGNSNSILPLLGFITNTTYNSSFIAGLETLTSVNVVNFLGPMRLNVKTSSFNIVNNFDTVEKGRTTTLCSVPVNSPAGGMISYFNFTNYKSIFKNHEISTLQLDIVDDVGNLINFNNKDWTMTLQIDIIT